MWSVNRLEYLIPTLTSTKDLVDWGEHEVYGIFIDDMPNDRDDAFITQLAKTHGYDKIILHTENNGLAKTWEETYNLIKDNDYDFIWHQEDDLTLNQKIKIDDHIRYLNSNDSCYQTVLSSQVWYSGRYEHNKELQERLSKSIQWEGFNTIEQNAKVFKSAFSLTKYSHYMEAIGLYLDNNILGVGLNTDISCFDEDILAHIFDHYSKNVQKNYNQWAIVFYDNNNDPLSRHIGEWTWGHRTTQEYLDTYVDDGWVKRTMQEHINNPGDRINSRTWEKL